MSGAKVAVALDSIVQKRGKPLSITGDNGSEFTSRALDAWAWQQGIQLVFITPGRPTENGYIESFNGRLRDKFLNVSVFFSLADVRQQLKSWQRDDNTTRPHSALADRTPNEFVTHWNQARFAFLHQDQAVPTACQGFPHGTLARGLDRPPGLLGEAANKKAKPPTANWALIRVTGLSYCSVSGACQQALRTSSNDENSTAAWYSFRGKVRSSGCRRTGSN